MEGTVHTREPAGGDGLVSVGLRSVLALSVLVAIGTGGYVLIEGWRWLDALFMAVITMTTIGFGETHPLSDAGRIFTILYIMGGLAVVSRALAEMARYVADGGLARDVRERRVSRELQHMRGHFIVVGYGRLGREIVADLRHHGAHVVVVDPSEADVVPADVVHVVGDATPDETLRQAGIEHAHGMAVATPTDAVNVYITLSAKQLNPALHVVTRVEEEAAAAKARRAGADRVLLPYHLGGARMSQVLLRPRTSAFVEHATERHFDDLQLEDVLVPEGSPVSGTLRDLDLRNRYGVIVVAVQRAGDERLHHPGVDTPIGPGDTLVVVGPPASVRGFVTSLGS